MTREDPIEYQDPSEENRNEDELVDKCELEDGDDEIKVTLEAAN